MRSARSPEASRDRAGKDKAWRQSVAGLGAARAMLTEEVASSGREHTGHDTDSDTWQVRMNVAWGWHRHALLEGPLAHTMAAGHAIEGS